VQVSATLLNGRHEVTNPFELVGADEDSISLAIAWALRCSPRFLGEFSKLAIEHDVESESATIRLHRYETGGGITDIEIASPGEYHLIVEAKFGWKLPGRIQLAKYAKRVSFKPGEGTIRRIVSLSECSEDYAAHHLCARSLDGVPIVHISWRSISAACARARGGVGFKERQILLDLAEYLESVVTSQSQDSNLVYVLALNAGTPDGWQTSWKDIVNRYSRYFHPVGNGWPREPPNYLAFRYDGRLQSIHHVEAYEVIEDLQKACPGIPHVRRPPHFLYHLGAPFAPPQAIKNGKIWPNGRYWCALDTLFTCGTVSEARDVTRRRRQSAQ